MQPTMKLRLLKVSSAQRGQPFTTDNYGNIYILQQWWEGETVPGRNDDGGEWRDIPIEVKE